MVPLAPRYDLRIVEALRALDDPDESMAEICRRVGDAAEQLGLIRPSYVHLRRILIAERERRGAVREVVEDVVGRLMVGRYVDGYAAVERIREARLPRPRPW